MERLYRMIVMHVFMAVCLLLPQELAAAQAATPSNAAPPDQATGPAAAVSPDIEMDDNASEATLLARIFPLKHADAIDVSRIIVELYGRDTTAVTVDERGNRVIVRGNENALEAIEELLKAIDSPAVSRSEVDNSSGGAASSSAAADKTFNMAVGFGESATRDFSLLGDGFSFYYGMTGMDATSLRREVEEREKQALELAKKLRGLEAGAAAPRTPSDTRTTDSPTKKLRTELREAVQKSFEAHQRLHRAEVVEFAERLNRIQKSLESRDQLADQIVDRRVEDLLNPDLRWEHTETFERSAAPSLAPRPHSRNEVREQPAPVSGRIELKNPTELKIEWLQGEGSFSRTLGPGRMKIESHFEIPLGETIMFRASNIAGHEGLAFFATIEMAPANPRTAAFLSHNGIPLKITGEDLDQMAINNLVTKVLYLPQSITAEIELVQEVVSTRLDPGLDPVAEAEKRGSILAVVRLMSRPERLDSIHDAADHDLSEHAIWDLLGMKLDDLPTDGGESPGLTISQLREGGPAAKAGLRLGDVLRGLDKWETNSLKDVLFVLRRGDVRSDDGNMKPLKVFLKRGKESLFSVLTISAEGKSSDESVPRR